jgi:hypothetical protein
LLTDFPTKYRLLAKMEAGGLEGGIHIAVIQVSGSVLVAGTSPEDEASFYLSLVPLFFYHSRSSITLAAMGGARGRDAYKARVEWSLCSHVGVRKVVRYTLRGLLTYLFGYEMQNSSFLMQLSS